MPLQASDLCLALAKLAHFLLVVLFRLHALLVPLARSRMPLGRRLARHALPVCIAGRWDLALQLVPADQDRTLWVAPRLLLAPAAASAPFSLSQGKVRACPAVQACTAQQPGSPSKLESVWLVRTPKDMPHLLLALLALRDISRIKRAKARACSVTQVHTAAAQASQPSVVYVLQDRSPLVAPPRLRARPAPQASTAQLQA